MDKDLYANHKWKKYLVYFDILLILIVILLLWVVKGDILMIIAFGVLIIYLILTKRTNALKHLGVSTLVAVLWLIIARKEYGYNQNFSNWIGLNIFPLLAWAIGLFAIYLIYAHWVHIIKNPTWLKKLLLFIAFFWPLLIFVETFAYHVFNIHNLSTAAYAGLPLCDCLHAKTWMQIAYFLIGPIYFGICEILKLENPHK